MKSAPRPGPGEREDARRVEGVASLPARSPLAAGCRGMSPSVRAQEFQLGTTVWNTPHSRNDMDPFSRREFIRFASASCGAGILFASGAAEANPLGLPIGSQTWPTRSMLGDF